jgi:putative iron-regulated protein
MKRDAKGQDMNRTLLTTSALALMLATAPAHAETSAEAVLETYVEIGGAVFGDALTAGQALEAAVKALIAAPSDETLTAARDAWKAARVPYAQSEVFRFGNPIVDDWEGKVNAWPLDEGLIDYVDPASVVSDENDYALLNIIANKTATIAGVEVDATTIAPELIADTLNEADGVETNVARGYHAIEFLLWGQDLNAKATSP